MATLTYFNPVSDRVTEVSEEQQVQREALDRSGFHQVEGERGSAEGRSWLRLPVVDLQALVQGIAIPEVLLALYKAEEQGQGRNDALQAIAQRIFELG